MTDTKNAKTQGSASTTAKTEAPAKTKKFVALRGIHTSSGKIKEGEVCSLTSEEARHFGKLKALGAYVPEADEEDEDEE